MKILSIKNKFSSRTQNLKLNVILSLIFNGLSVFASVAIIPLTIDILVDIKIYGIWLVMTSVINWTSVMDFGLSSGLKNKLTESITNEDINLSKKYISTSYFIQFAVFTVVSIVFFSCYGFINWSSFLELNDKASGEFALSFGLLFVFFFLRLILQIISAITAAKQYPFFGKLLACIANVAVLALIFIVKQTSYEIGIIGLTVIYGLTPVIIYFLATILFFGFYDKKLMPGFKYIDKTKARDLLNLGLKFFLIQISAIVLFSSGNFIVLKLFKAEMVTVYNIAYKLFSMMSVGFEVVAASFWVAYTQAWIKKDFVWIKQTNRRLLLIWGVIAIGGLVVLIFSEQIYHLWLGERVVIPFGLSLLSYIYFLLFTFGGVFNVFINGTGKIQLQWISLFISAILFIPLIYLFKDYLNLGIYSILLALILVNYYSIILAPLQYHKLVTGKAKGIFNK